MQIPKDVEAPKGAVPVMPPRKPKPGHVRRIVGWRFSPNNANEIPLTGLGRSSTCGRCLGAVLKDKQHRCLAPRNGGMPNSVGVWKPIFRWFKSEAG